MRAVIVYESMYGNTHVIADAIGEGLRESAAVVVGVHDADLVVVGGPTHAHGMTRATTRKTAVDAAMKPNVGLKVDPGARGPGVREWLDSLGHLDVHAAAVDTRIDAPPPLTGRAAKGIATKLRRHGCSLIAEPESFLVTKDNTLKPGEEAHARHWGTLLADELVPTAG
jgi:hypothetical protein